MDSTSVSWTEEPGRLQSMWLQRVRHDWATNTFKEDSIDTNNINASKTNILKDLRLQIFFYVIQDDKRSKKMKGWDKNQRRQETYLNEI